MQKGQTSIVIAVIGLIIVALVISGKLDNVIPEGLISFFGGTTYVSYEEYEQYQTENNGEVPDNLRVDLRDVLEPWLLAFPTAPGDCQAAGGTWHSDRDYVGCEGVGPAAGCAAWYALLAVQQCNAVNAVSQCDVNGVYCRYE